MKIKHWQGYGTVTATKIKDKNFDLVVKVVGNHEWGIHRDDEYDLFNWIVKRFDKSQTDYMTFHRRFPMIQIVNGYENGQETCTYYFNYNKEKWED